MTTNTDAPTWGAPQSPKPEHTGKGRRTAFAVGTALVLTLTGGGIVYATSGVGSSEQTGQNAAPLAGGGMAGGPFGTTTHGEFLQGEVAEISSSSISVTSSDGYTKTYTIPSNVLGTAQDLQAGDTVTVVSEDGAAAATITEAGATPGQDGQQAPTN